MLEGLIEVKDTTSNLLLDYYRFTNSYYLNPTEDNYDKLSYLCIGLIGEQSFRENICSLPCSSLLLEEAYFLHASVLQCLDY